MNTELPIHKLPKWAQDHIHTLQHQRDTAVKALKDWTDTQTEQPISVSEMEGLENGGPTIMKRYVEGTDIDINWMGVRLSVMLRKEGNMHENAINLQWEGECGGSSHHVAMIPTSFQSVSLIAKENMR